MLYTLGGQSLGDTLTKYIIEKYNVIRPLYKDYKLHHIVYHNYYEQGMKNHERTG